MISRRNDIVVLRSPWRYRRSRSYDSGPIRLNWPPIKFKIPRMAMNFVFCVHTCITRIPILWDLLRGSVGLKHGHYRPPNGRSKFTHHAVCAVRPLIARLMNCCHATLAIMLLSLTVSDTVHSFEIIYFLKFLALWNSSYHWSWGHTDFYTKQIKLNK